MDKLPCTRSFGFNVNLVGFFCQTGSNTETWLEDGCHHPRTKEGDQDHEHTAVRAHDDVVTGADRTHRTDAGQGTLSSVCVSPAVLYYFP